MQRIPCKFIVWFQIDDCLKEFIADFMSQPILERFNQSVTGSTKGKLNRFFLPFICGGGRDDRPIRVIESGSQVMDGVTGDVCGLSYEGFVSFREDGNIPRFLYFARKCT